LSGGGKVILSNSLHNAIVTHGSAATLTNAGNTISGAGTIGDATLTLINSGNIDGNASSTLTISTGTHRMINSGTLQGATSAGLAIESDVANAKTIAAAGTNANVLLDGITVTNASAGLILASGVGAHVDLDGVTVSGGKLQTVGSNAVIETVSGSTSNLLSGGSTVAGSILKVTNGTALTLEGTVANAGTIAVSGTTSATTLALDGATITGPGKLTTSGASALIETVSGTTDAIKGGTLVSGSLLEVVSASTLTLSGGTLGTGAIVQAASGGTAIVSGSVTNGGTLFASGAGSLIDIVGVVNGGIAEVGDGIVEIAGSGSESIRFLSTGTGGLEIADTQAHTSAFSGRISGFGGLVHTNSSHFIDLISVTSAGHYLELCFRQRGQYQRHAVRLQRRPPGCRDQIRRRLLGRKLPHHLRHRRHRQDYRSDRAQWRQRRGRERPDAPAAWHRFAQYRLWRTDHARLCGERSRHRRHAVRARWPPRRCHCASWQLHGRKLRHRRRWSWRDADFGSAADRTAAAAGAAAGVRRVDDAGCTGSATWACGIFDVAASVSGASDRASASLRLSRFPANVDQCGR
jgi:hypothetical protein